MKDVTGSCIHCGQTKVIQVPDSWTHSQIDADVTMQCDCEAAAGERTIEDIITHTKAKINKFFEKEKDLEFIQNMLLACVEPLARRKMTSVSLTSGNYKASMKRKEGTIAVTLTYTDSQKIE